MPHTGARERLPAVALLLGAGALGCYAAARAAGAGAGVLAAAATGCAVALLLRTRPRAVDAASAAVAFDAALLLLPGALTVYLAFDSGGYFPAATAVAALLLIVALVLRLTLAAEPFAGFSWPLAVAASGLGLYAGWILLSATWSDAPARALLDFDRALVYVLALVLFGSIPRTPERLRLMAGGLACGIVAVAAVALATRLFPTTFETTPNLGDAHLSFPLTYSNALGMLCVLGAILCLYFTTSLGEPLGARAAAAAALPLLATTGYLTQSRGPVVAAAAGVLAFVLLGRPRGLVTGLIAAVPAAVVAIVAAHHQSLLTAVEAPAQAVADDGRPVAVIVALCCAAAAALRVLLAMLDRRLQRLAPSVRRRRGMVAALWTGAAVLVLAVVLVANASGELSEQYDRTVSAGLVDNWSVALDAFGEQPLRGQGAGTYETYWNAHRPADQGAYNVTDAHSLYLESLGELGLVGTALLIVVLAALLVFAAPFRRGGERATYAALFALALAWVVHAAGEWDWEMPAVTVWLVALGAACLAARPRPLPREPGQAVRVALGLLVLAAAVTPGLVLASQQQLDDAVAAFDRGDCGAAVERATASISTLATRPEPYEVLAACQARRGSDLLAVRAMLKAVARDPRNWRYRYDLAVARGAAGIDPAPDLLAAQRLNPQNPDVKAALASLEPGTTIAWEPVLGPARFGRR